MQKVKNIYLETEVPANQELGVYATGLILEMENGDRYSHTSTDPVVTWTKL